MYGSGRKREKTEKLDFLVKKKLKLLVCLKKWFSHDSNVGLRFSTRSFVVDSFKM